MDDELSQEGGEPPAIDWNNPIPGNTHAIQGEIDRVRYLRDRCREAATSIRNLALHSWRGPAAEQFESLVPRLVRQWTDAEDEHDRWADALSDYRDVLLILQPRARAAIEQAKQDGGWTVAQADVMRWREQADTEARKTAEVLHDVADRLRALPHLLDEQATDAMAPAAATGQPVPNRGIRAWGTDAGIGQNGTEPAAVHQSPAALSERVTALCDAVLDAEFVSAEQL